VAEPLINGRFQLVGLPARPGGLAEVRKAVDILSPAGDPVAVKLLRRREEGDVIDIFLERETGALRELDHPNIVQMIDSGWNEELGRYFVILEWIEHSLKEDLRAGESMSWPAFFARIGAPLASALAHAHMREVEHRDIKPANVLITTSGQVKLADFGIAKIRSKIDAPDRTVAEYRSNLFTPPEQIDSVPYVRDVFGYGVLAIQVMSGGRAAEYHDLAPVLDSLDLDPEVHAVLRSCVDFDPALRPANAAVLEQRLQGVERMLDDRHARRSNYLWMQLTRTAAESILGLPRGGDVDWARAQAAVLTDLGGAVHADYGYNAQTKETDQDTLRLAGRSLFLRLKPDEKYDDRVVIVQAQDRGEEWLAKWRARALPLGPVLTFAFEDPGEDAAHEGVQSLLRALDGHLEDRAKAQQARASRTLGDLFQGWSRLLDAREEVAAGGRQALPYDRVVAAADGKAMIFHLSGPASASLLGEEWSVADYAQGRPLERGEVTAETDESVVLKFRRTGTRIPDRGVLLPYLGPSQTSLNRQRDALATLAADSTANRSLRAIIEDPAAMQVGRPAEITTWFRGDLDESKRQVVRHALGSQDLLLVEGPPGTGKTTVIAEIVEQTLKRSPQARILIVSQTHIAIDNALRRIEDAGVTSLVRLGRPDDPRVADSAQHLLLDRQVKRWSKQVRGRAEGYLKAVAERNGVETRHLRAALLLEELAAVAGNLEHVEQHMLDLTDQPTAERTTSARELGEQLVTARARRDDLAEQRHELFTALQQALAGDLTLKEEMSAADAHDVVEVLLGAEGPGRELTGLLRLQGEWLQRIETDPNLVASFLRTCHVVGGTALGFLGHPAARDLEFDTCIFDEASKATATEALVPLVRSKRWILVGDTRQLPPLDEDLLREPQIMREYRLVPELVTTTLFQYLIDHTTTPVRHMLTEQYRMTPAIGNMISHCFYGNDLKSPNPQVLEGYTQVDKPVLWLDTSAHPSRRESERTAAHTSISNRSEAQLVLRRLQFLDRAITHKMIRPDGGRKLDVLVIAPYARQVEELRRQLASARLTHLVPEVLSVDAVQGRECDLAIFSVTRSNDRGDFGFLGQAYWRRINVALSRARFGLIVVGDAAFCRSKPGALREVLDYMAGHPQDCEVRDAHI